MGDPTTVVEATTKILTTTLPSTSPKRLAQGLTGNTLFNLEKGIDHALHPLVVSRPAFIAGVIMLLTWHALRVAPSYRSPMMRTLGVALVVVNLYFNDYVGVKAPFVFSICWIIMDQAVLWWLSVLIVDKMMGKKWDPSRDHYDFEGKKHLVTNRYMQVGSHLRNAVYFFIVQVALMLYYIYDLNADPETHNEKIVSFTKWGVALIITIIAGENEVGTPFNEYFWTNLLAQPLSDKACVHFNCISVKLKYEFYFRRFMSFVINKIFRTIVLGTAPILLSVADPLDFIKDCMALFFMTRLDDLDDRRGLHVELEDMQLRRDVSGVASDAFYQEMKDASQVRELNAGSPKGSLS